MTRAKGRPKWSEMIVQALIDRGRPLMYGEIKAWIICQYRDKLPKADTDIVKQLRRGLNDGKKKCLIRSEGKKYSVNMDTVNGNKLKNPNVSDKLNHVVLRL